MAENSMGPGVHAGEVVLRSATGADLQSVLRLLRAAELPVEGVVEHFGTFLVAVRGGRLVGVGGLEVHGRDGVLRSVAVAAERRGGGVGGRLTERVLESARSAGLRRVYLLTTTAADYFPRYGFSRIDRSEASAAVQRSVEFSKACPASAVVMVLELRDEGMER